MKTKQWKVIDFGSLWTGPEIGEEVSKLSANGWEVHQIQHVQGDFTLNKRFDDSTLIDGDSINVGIFTRVWFNK